MKKEILIYEKDKDVLKFLKSFFKEKKEYSAHFVRKDRNTLRKKIAGTMPDAVIVSSPDGLRHLNPSIVKCPIIAMISTNETRGIHSAIKSDVECYLLSPFHKEELDHKLRVFLNREGVMDTLFKENEDFSVLLELATLASSTLNPREVLYLIVKKISETIKVTRCSIISINAENQRYADVISSFEDPGISKVRIDLQKYPEIRKSLSIKKPVVIKDAQRDPLMK